MQDLAQGASAAELPDEITSSGLPFVGDLTWGDHFCHFYETADDLRDCLVPYFMAGLRNNEKCLWVASDPFGTAEATAALRDAMPNVDVAIARGQVEIIDHQDWYLRLGRVNPEELPRMWLGRVERALAEGYRGLRVTGNVAFLEPVDWQNFMHYEEAVHRCFHGQRIVALCSYPLRLAQSESILDVIRRHGFAIARREGRWETVESAALAQAKQQLAELNRELERRVEERTASLQAALSERKKAEDELRERERQMREMLESLPAAIYTTDAAGRITFFNQAAVDFAGRRPVLGSDEWCVSWRLYRTDGTPMRHDECPMAISIRENRAVRDMEAVAERPDGTRRTFIPFPTPLRDSRSALVGAINMLVDITERKKGEEQMMLLMREIDHRAKNMLATVQAIARMTRADSTPAYIETLVGRIQALARAHTLLASSRWEGAELRRLAEEELAPFGIGLRVRIAGPAVALSPEAAQAFGMILHELTTNAAKYGALSVESGHVTVAWHWSGDHLVLGWNEKGGPAVEKPERTGFGMTLIGTTVEAQLGGEVRTTWNPDGLVCELRVPAEGIKHR